MARNSTSAGVTCARSFSSLRESGGDDFPDGARDPLADTGEPGKIFLTTDHFIQALREISNPQRRPAGRPLPYRDFPFARTAAGRGWRAGQRFRHC